MRAIWLRRRGVVLDMLEDVEQNHRIIGVRRQRTVGEIEADKRDARHLLAELDKRSERIVAAGQRRIGQAAAHIGKQVTGRTADFHDRDGLCAECSLEFIDGVIARGHIDEVGARFRGAFVKLGQFVRPAGFADLVGENPGRFSGADEGAAVPNGRRLPRLKQEGKSCHSSSLAIAPCRRARRLLRPDRPAGRPDRQS